jgi:hypothetical protein
MSRTTTSRRPVAGFRAMLPVGSCVEVVGAFGGGFPTAGFRGAAGRELHVDSRSLILCAGTVGAVYAAARPGSSGAADAGLDPPARSARSRRATPAGRRASCCRGPDESALLLLMPARSRSAPPSRRRPSGYKEVCEAPQLLRKVCRTLRPSGPVAGHFEVGREPRPAVTVRSSHLHRREVERPGQVGPLHPGVPEVRPQQVRPAEITS